MRFVLGAISAGQLRAARGLIGWSQGDLAKAADVGRATIADFEAGKREPYARTLDNLRAALETAGVIFVEENGEGPGVRLRKPIAPPAYTPKDFFATVAEFETSRFDKLRRELKPTSLASRLQFERRNDGIALFIGPSREPIGLLTLVGPDITFEPELIEGRDHTYNQWLTPNELARWVSQAFDRAVRE
jgi:transcriptional regulator with XRE-family HTH domain